MLVYVSPNYVVPAIWIKRWHGSCYCHCCFRRDCRVITFSCSTDCIITATDCSPPSVASAVQILRIWLERKITPDSLLQLYIDDIEVPINVLFGLRGLSMIQSEKWKACGLMSTEGWVYLSRKLGGVKETKSGLTSGTTCSCIGSRRA